MYNIEKKKNKINTVSWNHEGFKIGLCSQPPVNMKYGLLCLSNNTAITDCFKRMSDRFMLLYNFRIIFQKMNKIFSMKPLKI